MSRPPLPGGPYLVVGLARSGIAAGMALLARGERVLATDRDPARGGELAAAGAEIVADGVAALDRVASVVKSPGVRPQEPVIASARARGIAVLGELELAWRLLENELVAVTGTNGKTTTVELIGAIHRAAGVPAVVAGNVGLALSRLAAAPPFGDGPLDPGTVIVCEVSSFQLEDAVALAPQAAVLLNLAADHLDRHGDMAAYVGAKLRLFALQGPGDLAVLPAAGTVPVPGQAQRLTFGSAAGADLLLSEGSLWWRGERLASAADVRLRGAHNLENAMAAAAVALGRGLPREAVVAALASFAGVAHRLEEVAQADGVLYINDSKATNIASTLVALRSFAPGSVHLILGGRGGGQDYAPLREEVERRARAVYVIGEDAEPIARALAGLPVIASGTLAAAVTAAAAAAAPGEVVLLSPACKSFDQFRDFEARGEAFRALAVTAAGVSRSGNPGLQGGFSAPV